MSEGLKQFQNYNCFGCKFKDEKAKAGKPCCTYPQKLEADKDGTCLTRRIKFKQCTCIEQPMGAHGLEGYILNDRYYFELKPKDKNGKPYYRVYPSLESEVYRSNNYETCGTGTFKRFFKEVK